MEINPDITSWLFCPRKVSKVNAYKFKACQKSDFYIYLFIFVWGTDSWAISFLTITTNIL